jgi:very-short-patch-repair endonuclease
MSFVDSNFSDEKKAQIEKLEKNLKTYQEKLLQVDRRNRSVQFKKIFAKHNFDLASLEEFNSGICDKISEKVVKNRTSSLNFFLDSIDVEDSDVIRGKLRKLSNNLKQIEGETGQQTGFVGFPFLQGHANSDFFIRGPLVLFPINLEQKRQAKGGGWFLNFLDSRPIFNGALIAAIKKKAELKIPENIEESFDDLIDDLIEYDKLDIEEYFLKKITEWANNIVPLDETKIDFTLQKIPSLTRKDIEDLGIQKFHLLNYKILGNFPQADNEIYKDYGKLLENASSLDIGTLGDLIDVYNPDDDVESDQSFEEIELDAVPDSKLNTVLDSDSSQDRVILESKRSNLVVVRGPPGTGKSQVITNLISDALTNQKKILVVCQKRAALDVVYQRLSKVGLEKFVVVLDKEHEDRLKMYQQLYGTIEDPGHYSSGEMSLEQASGQIDKRIKTLSELGKALHKPYFGGTTAQKLYSLSKSSYHPQLDLSWIGLSIEWNDLDDYLQKIRGIEPLFKKFELDENPWTGRKDFSNFGLREKSEIAETIDSLKNIIGESLLASNPEHQDELVLHFDRYLNDPGFLKRNQKTSAKRISDILSVSDVDESFIRNNSQKIIKGINFWKTLPILLKLFNDTAQQDFHTLVKNPSNFVAKLDLMKQSLSDYDSMQDYDKKLSEFDSSIEKLLFACKDKLNANEDWSKIIEQEIYALWIDTIERENSILKGDPIEEYNRNQESLAKLLQTKKDIVRKQIQSKIAGSITIPDISGKAQTPEKRAWKDFSAELKKKRRTKPVRQLFEKYPSNFLKIAPCWLASPESVCKVFPLKRNLFDLVIVDEASQLAVERALPFLYRAKNVVIAGDEKQLQPFDLFQLKEDEDDDFDDEITEEKSLLDLAIVRNAPIQLAWHYRSRYQDLINFSNHAFYDGLLQVAPNVRTDPTHPPIRWIPCNGVWDKRQNHVEAATVLDEITKTWIKYSKTGNYPSIGVITFNDEQKDLIQEQFDKKLDTDTSFQQLHALATEGKKIDDRPFFKNIENVQGDERDIIIFSIGYAKDPDGVFGNRFGTLSKAGGQNRLNVAITRARQEMVVVCSVDPSLIKETSKNLGPRRLRQFLEYSRASSQLHKEGVEEVLSKLNENMTVSDKTTLEFDSPFETQVYKALSRHGYTVHTQIGASDYKIDLAVVHPDDPYRYVLAIECDGATFHSSKSAKERDVMRQKFLEDKGWKFERIWSRNWWRNSEKEIDRIISRIKKELSSPSSMQSEPTVEPTREPTVEPTREPTVEPTREPTVEPTREPTVEPTREPSSWLTDINSNKKKEPITETSHWIKYVNSNKKKEPFYEYNLSTDNSNKILLSEIKSYIQRKKLSKTTIQTQTSILRNFSDLAKQNPNKPFDEVFRKFVAFKSPSSVSHSKSVIGGFLKYRGALPVVPSTNSRRQSLIKNEPSKILSKAFRLFKNNSITQEELVLMCYLEGKQYSQIQELVDISRSSIMKVCILSPEDKARILKTMNIFNNDDIRKILSKLSKSYNKGILIKDEYEKLRDTLEAILHGDASDTVDENHILSKDDASAELSLLPQKLANKEITSEEYKQKRDELESILFD